MSETSPTAAANSELFEQHRPFLQALAYRLLGEATEAEDIVQETWLRWSRAERSAITEPRAYLARIATRLCIDHLKSARARRETYVGPWLPEPVVRAADFTEKPARDLAHDITYALMVALERLSPLERAAFLLHDVFGLSFNEIGETLDRDAAACRQLAARARTHVRTARSRFTVPPAEGERIAALFMEAAQTGNVAALSDLLAADAVMHSDGGAFARAARRPIIGPDRISRFLAGIVARNGPAHRLIPTPIDGQPGFAKCSTQGLTDAYVFDIREGRVAALYVVRNPEKLAHLAAKLGLTLAAPPPAPAGGAGDGEARSGIGALAPPHAI